MMPSRTAATRCAERAAWVSRSKMSSSCCGNSSSKPRRSRAACIGPRRVRRSSLLPLALAASVERVVRSRTMGVSAAASKTVGAKDPPSSVLGGRSLRGLPQRGIARRLYPSGGRGRSDLDAILAELLRTGERLARGGDELANRRRRPDLHCRNPDAERDMNVVHVPPVGKFQFGNPAPHALGNRGAYLERATRQQD